MSSSHRRPWAFLAFIVSIAVWLFVGVVGSEVFPEKIQGILMIGTPVMFAATFVWVVLDIRRRHAAWNRHRAQNLIQCPDCGHQVSKRAAQCPNCGAPQSQ